MHISTRTRIAVGSIAAAGLLLSVLPLAAQSRTPAAPPVPDKKWTTSWGDPDLQGSWTNATNTPLVRPAKYGTREFMTPEELKLAQENLRDERGATPERDLAAGYDAFWWEGRPPDGRTSLIYEPADGQIPYAPAGRQRRAAFLKVGNDSAQDHNIYDRCIMRHALPRLPTAYNNNYEIIQTPGYVAILQEIMHDVRLVPLDGRAHLDAGVRQWMGDSRGHWEGQTLVVETTNFSDRTDFEGSGPNMRLVEKWTRVADGRIEYRFTVEDSTAWTQPWSAMLSWNAIGPIYEYACHEGNYALVDMLEGGRREEAEAAAKAVK